MFIATPFMTKVAFYATYISLFATILRKKQLKDIKKSFDYITVEKIISIHGIFVSDRTTNMHFSRMQNKIYGS